MRYVKHNGIRKHRSSSHAFTAALLYIGHCSPPPPQVPQFSLGPRVGGMCLSRPPFYCPITLVFRLLITGRAENKELLGFVFAVFNFPSFVSTPVQNSPHLRFKIPD